MSDSQQLPGERTIRRSHALEVAARTGIATRGVLYLLVAALIGLLAVGSKHHEADQRGALQALASHAGGKVMVFVVFVGLAGYALWRLFELVFGPSGQDDGVQPRLDAGLGTIGYGFLAWTAGSVLAGERKSSEHQSAELSAHVMTHTGGRFLVAAIGIGIIVGGGFMLYEGVTGGFAEQLRFQNESRRVRTAVRWLGTVGTSGRGLVFVAVGAVFIDAAVEFDPHKATGIDGLLRTIQGAAFGPALLLLTAVILGIFGVYCWAEARWRVT